MAGGSARAFRCGNGCGWARGTFEVICRAVFGVHEPERVRVLRAALLSLLDMGSVFLLPGPLRADLGRWSPGGRLGRRLDAADRLLYEEIERRRQAPDLDSRSDVLSLLLCARDEEGRPMTDVELRDELITLLAAGHETTATGLAFAFDLARRTIPPCSRAFGTNSAPATTHTWRPSSPRACGSGR